MACLKNKSLHFGKTAKTACRKNGAKTALPFGLETRKLPCLRVGA